MVQVNCWAMLRELPGLEIANSQCIFLQSTFSKEKKNVLLLLKGDGKSVYLTVKLAFPTEDNRMLSFLASPVWNITEKKTPGKSPMLSSLIVRKAPGYNASFNSRKNTRRKK